MRATEEETYTDEEIDKLAEEIASEIANDLSSLDEEDGVSDEEDEDEDEDEVEETKKSSSKKSVKTESKKRSKKSEGENPFEKDEDEDEDEVEETKKSSSKKSAKTESKKASSKKSVKSEQEDDDEEDEEDEDVSEEVSESKMQKQEMIRNVFARMQRTRKTSLTDNYEKLMGLLFQEEDDEDDEDKDEVEENSTPIYWSHNKVTKEDLDISDDIKGIFGSSDGSLSEDFMDTASKIFESAVVAKINSELDLIEASYATKLEDEKESLTEEITEKVDNYLSYVVSEWVESNELAIETGLKSEITEDFIGGLKKLFEEHYIELPDDKVDVVESLADKVDKLEEQLNETLSNNIELSAQVNSFTKNQILADVSDDLTDVQKDKINSLAENIDFADVDEYREALVNIKEGYFSTATTTSNASRTVDQEESELTEGNPPQQSASPQMQHYMNVIGRTTKY